MGISSNQVRFLQLTDRKHTIGRELNRLANDKMELTRDMSKATSVYQDALNAKVLKWSSNSGVSYVDLSYKNLMKPSQMNGNTAYLLTDSSEKVVIDYNYKKYAEMISSKGAPGGNWEANRAKILSEIVGVPEATINGIEASSSRVASAKAKLDAVNKEKPTTDTFKNTANLSDLLKNNLGSNLGSSHANFVEQNNWSDAYQKGGKINLGSNISATGDSVDVLSNIGSTLAKGLANYFVTESTDFDAEESPIYDAIDDVVSMLSATINANKTSEKFLSKDGDNYLLDVKNFINEIFSYLPGSINCESTGDDYKIDYYDTTSTAFKQYKEVAMPKWKADVKAAEAEYNAALNADNSLLTADQERQIKFYDDLFSTIAEKGWTYNDNVDDDDFLNQMLQNNIYTITTVSRNKVEDKTNITEDYYWQNTYNTDIATNYTNIFTVNDSDARLLAQTEYEKTKAIINTKETRIDTRMQTLKTEQDAINTMIQSLESIVDENTEKFGIFA